MSNHDARQVLSIGAHTIAKALGGRKSGSDWIAHCPAHQDRTPSLAIHTTDDGQVLVHCHAGCRQDQVIARLKSLGLWPGNGARSFGRTTPKEGAENWKRTQAALAIWQQASPAQGTLVETYLASRGLNIAPPSTLRFHQGLKHRSGGNLPAMIALVTRGVDDVPVAVHRTFLAGDGSGKAPIDPQKMMLGPCRGGVVRLASVGDALMVGEGIETCLAAMQATGKPAWAALSTSGLGALSLPDGVREVIVLADGDPAGEAAAHQATVRWKREGRRVRVAHPPQGLDFNDMLLGGAPSLEGGRQ